MFLIEKTWDSYDKRDEVLRISEDHLKLLIFGRLGLAKFGSEVPAIEENKHLSIAVTSIF